jgi:hypothetical protein
LSIALYGAENWTLRKVDQNYPESLEMCWRRIEKNSWTDGVRIEVLHRVKGERTSFMQQNESRLNELVTSWVGTAF